MKKLMTLLAVVLLVYVQPSGAQTTEKESLFWEISGNGLQQPSYLFGTIHMICKKDFVMAEVVHAKLNQCAEVYLEFDMDDPAMQMKMMNGMKLPEGQSLKQLFGSDYEVADSFFKAKTGFSILLFNQFKPMMLQSLLYQKILPCSEQESYETYFLNLAQASGKNLNGLESLESQIAIFDSIPDREEIQTLMEWVRNIQKQEDQFQRMIDLYKQQNLTQLYEYIRNSPEMAGYQELLLNNRNRNWIPVMEKAMQNQSVFFAVGAGHLPGSFGVLELLRKKGYRVRPVQL